VCKKRPHFFKVVAGITGRNENGRTVHQQCCGRLGPQYSIVGTQLAFTLDAPCSSMLVDIMPEPMEGGP
jgi:hypothetical protein